MIHSPDIAILGASILLLLPGDHSSLDGYFHSFYSYSYDHGQQVPLRAGGSS
jgi:hypothetical protein